MNKAMKTVYHTDIPMGLTAKMLCLAALMFLAAGTSGYALLMKEMPKELQTTNAEPRMRTLSLKLPLRQPEFHWTFMNREELLAGKLVLRITRSDKTNEIVIFESGQMQDGWEAMNLPNPKAGQIYFGFKSSKRYATAPNDRLDLELRVKQDLSGIGPLQKGVLPAGSYKARGTYSGLLDEYKMPDQLKEAPKETREKLRQVYEFVAFLETWQEQWDLRITSEDGWLPPEQRQQYQKMLEQMPKEDGTTKN
jgi:hypothetical protein